ncbi:MAG: ABC transporter permease [Actinobacteria bacterium]|nr:ABC transporter permease [Actinomycetota bacterium]
MRLFFHELKGEQLLYWRSREAAFFTFIFPLLLYVLVSAFYTGDIYGQPAGRVLLAGLLGYGAATTSFAGIAIFLVIRRENGVLKRLRATPLPPAMYIAALLGSTLLVFAIEAAAMIGLARVTYHVGVPDRLGSLALSLLLGAAAFAALGIAMAAAIRSAEGASAVVNLVVLPMAFLSGSFGPTRHFPHVLRAIADVLPLTYLVRLVRSAIVFDQPIWHEPGAIGVVAGWGLVGLVLAVWAFRWEPSESG